LNWQVMDVTKMAYENEHFGAVIDKGTLDAILCGEGSSQASEKMLTDIARVLKPDGVFVCITYGQPSNRLHYLKKKNLTGQLVTKLSQNRQAARQQMNWRTMICIMFIL